MRLYANIVNTRLVLFTGSLAFCFPGQAGFWPFLSTLHPLFILQHFLDSSTTDARPLYCCCFGLKGDYDRVQRPLLWQALQSLAFMFTC